MLSSTKWVRIRQKVVLYSVLIQLLSVHTCAICQYWLTWLDLVPRRCSSTQRQLLHESSPCSSSLSGTSSVLYGKLICQYCGGEKILSPPWFQHCGGERPRRPLHSYAFAPYPSLQGRWVEICLLVSVITVSDTHPFVHNSVADTLRSKSDQLRSHHTTNTSLHYLVKSYQL